MRSVEIDSISVRCHHPATIFKQATRSGNSAVGHGGAGHRGSNAVNDVLAAVTYGSYAIPATGCTFTNIEVADAIQFDWMTA